VYGSCRNCGGQFPHTIKCPAKGKTCNFCKKHNHCRKVCRSRLKREDFQEVKTKERHERFCCFPLSLWLCGLIFSLYLLGLCGCGHCVVWTLFTESRSIVNDWAGISHFKCPSHC
jgi:hypothetical protein